MPDRIAYKVMLAAVDLSRLGDAVRWEPSRGGQLFPHIHPLSMKLHETPKSLETS